MTEPPFPMHGIVLSPPDGGGIYVVPQPIDESWLAVHYVDTRNGVPTTIEIRVVPMTGDGDDGSLYQDLVGHVERIAARPRPEQPLSARALQRRMKPGQAVTTLRAIPNVLSDAGIARMGLTRDVLATEPPRARRGRRERDRWLSGVAEVYAETLERRSTSPIQDVRRKLNDEHGSERFSDLYVRDIIKQARDHGLLEPRHPGRGNAIGRLTEKARRLLDLDE